MYRGFAVLTGLLLFVARGDFFMRICLVFLFSLLLGPFGFGLEVVTLHPLLADWARQVGGEKVKVVNLADPGTDLHGFSPGADDLRAMSSAEVILASGKGMEPYLEGLRDSLKPGQVIVEVGEVVPVEGDVEHAELGLDV